MPVVDVSVLGPVGVSVGGTAVAVGGPRRQAVIARLLVDRRAVVAADALADAVWDGAPPDAGNANLHVLVSKLRRALGAAGADRGEVLRTVPPGYVLAVAENGCDIGRFDALRRTGQDAAAGAAHERAAEAFAAALAQWRGEAFASVRGIGYFDGLARVLGDSRNETRSALVDSRLATGRCAEVVADLQVLLREDPYAEQHWSRLILAQAASGRTAAALESCRRMREMFAAELGVEPGAAVVELERRVRAGTAGPAAVPGLRTTIGTAPAGARRGRMRRLPDGAVFPVGPRGLRIGRAPDNDLVLGSEDVSRYHAEILFSRVGPVIRDRGSLNLTRVRGADLPRGATELLDHGDEIEICGATFVFELDSPIPQRQ